MFNLKNGDVLKEEEPYIKEKDVVVCDDCKCLVLEQDAQTILSYGWIPERHYCMNCKKEYSKVTHDVPVDSGNLIIHYWKWIECDKDGKPLTKK